MSATDEGWRIAYAALDSATLLALLPVLKEGKDKALEWVKHESQHHEQLEGSDAYTAQLLGEALAAFDARTPAEDEDARGKLGELRKTVHEILGGQASRTREAKADMRMSEFLWAHQQREQWILEELTRRGLLPAFPQKRATEDVKPQPQG
ncbi:hypothetical protein [Streptomyces sp. NPDC046197]|uniref:hypothetical protein n=1 Tax=Streptomyces sp. NPDC046197 TaxID=3154337 RepID=UPI0033DF2982